ncbi:MAG: hypothetical protein HKN82_13350 [Akkermansiaceae bacterium]|nr:hypothetical protein [Akkermansiaceae bacterium]NNM27986.1 hypothetical protein [Akkermansiaceae bacterium]
MEKKASWGTVVFGVARALLHDRNSRRKFILWVIVAMLLVVALGNWPLEEWLAETPLRFVLWWAGCAFLAVLTFLLGLYDALAVLKENQRREGDH